MSADGNQGAFPATSWTLIARLRSDDESTARRALDDLCAQYRYPLYCAIRHRGLPHHDAEDALHDFLAKLLRLEAFADLEAEKGRLRAFLNTALGRFLINWRRDRAHLGREMSFDTAGLGEEADLRFRAERFPAHALPERLFDLQWARALLARVLERFAADYAARGKSAIFTTLSPALQRGGSLRGEDTRALTVALGQSETTLRKTHQRFLADYRRVLEDEVLQTVATRAELAGEIAHLLAAFQKE